MRGQQGYLLVEIVLAVGILALLTGLAAISVRGVVSSYRVSRVTHQLADHISMARERAIARYEVWRIKFIRSGGSPAVTAYVIQSCSLGIGQSGSTHCKSESGWTDHRYVALERGTGLDVPVTGKGEPISLRFDRTGRLLRSEDTPIAVCLLMKGPNGEEVCRPGPAARIILIHRWSGAVEVG